MPYFFQGQTVQLKTGGQPARIVLFFIDGDIKTGLAQSVADRQSRIAGADDRDSLLHRLSLIFLSDLQSFGATGSLRLFRRFSERYGLVQEILGQENKRQGGHFDEIAVETGPVVEKIKKSGAQQETDSTDGGIGKKPEKQLVINLEVENDVHDKSKNRCGRNGNDGRNDCRPGHEIEKHKIHDQIDRGSAQANDKIQRRISVLSEEIFSDLKDLYFFLAQIAGLGPRIDPSPG